MASPIKLKISLENDLLEISRKILVPQNINMMQLHYTIQLAMGWTFSHMFQFCDNKVNPSVIASYGMYNEFDVLDVEETPADKLMLKDEFSEKREGKPFWYWYDFGDDWWHRISFLKISKEDNKIFKGVPKLIDAVGACPPEDVGGMSGYKEFLEVMEDMKHPEYKSFCLWAGIDPKVKRDPMYVNIQLYNAYLTGYYFSPDWKLTAHKFFNSSPTPFLDNLF